MFHVDRRRYGIDQAGDIGRAANLVELPPSLQLVADGEKIDRLPSLVEDQGRVIDPAMFLPVKVLVLEDSGHTDDRIWVNEKRTQNRLFRFEILGR
jgi:hypothetical protein